MCRPTLFLIAAALFTALLTIPVGPAEAGTSNGPNPPKGVHLSFLDDPTKAVVTWHTTTSSTSRVEWGPNAGPPYPNGAAGTDYVSNGGTFLHAATMTGLTPGETVHYRVGDATMASWYGDATFRAALPKGALTPFVFVSSGDFGNSANTQATANAMAATDPDLVALLGDYYYTSQESSVRAVWERFQVFGEKAITMTAIGNHEHSDPAPIDNHCAFVNLPGNERTFSFAFGNAFFVSVDWGGSSSDQTDGVDGSGGPCGGAAGTAAIRTWLDGQLASANNDANITWKFVFQHFQCYLTDHDKTNSLCPNGAGSPDQVEDIFVNRGVDVVLTAHAHTYGRTHPVKFNEVMQTGNVYDDPGAPIYLVIGTGGLPRTSTCRTEPYIAVCLAPTPKVGFGWLRVTPNNVSFEYRENTEGVLDAFVLKKTPPNDYDVSVSPTSMTLPRDATGTATVSVVGVSDGPVSLSQTGCPADTSCTLLPPVGPVPFTSTLTVTTTPSSPFGTHPMTIVASNATTSRTANFTLTIASQLTVSFQKGDGGAYSETDDTYITDGGPNTNYGGETRLRVDASGCPSKSKVCKALIKFPDFLGPNPGQVPMGSTIQQALLAFTVTNPGGTQRFYRVTESWGEFTATWNSFSPPGSPANAGLAGTYEAPTGPVVANIAAVVQQWADGAVNEGILIDSASSDGVEYVSSEGSPAPKLTVTFSPPGTPPPFNFQMAVDPGSGSTSPGGSVATTATATLLSGTPEPVTFGCEDLPTGASCAFVPPVCAPTCSSALAISTSLGTPTGTYAIRVTGRSTSLDREAVYTLTVANTVTLSFQKGDGGAYSETDDTYLASNHPNTNFGSESIFTVDARDCRGRRGVCVGLLTFPNFLGPNPGQVPPGSTIESAILQVTFVDSGGTQEAYQLLEGWGEHTATWNSFSPPGSPAKKSPPVAYASPRARVSIDVTAIVQNWANGDANHGWVITTASSNGADYASSEGASADRPRLTVTFQPPSGAAAPPSPPPSGAGAVSAAAIVAAPVLLALAVGLPARAEGPARRRLGT